jgi:hypothetical protein
MIYLIRSAADISVAFFVAKQIVRMRRPDFLIRAFLIGTSVAAIGGILEWVTKFDWYGNITGLVPMNYPYRMRGFNFEPRGLGLIAAQGLLLLLLIYARTRSRKILALSALHAFALLLSGSTSAVIVFAAAAMVLLMFDRTSRRAMAAPFATVGLVLGGLVMSHPLYFATFKENALLRLTTDRIDIEDRPEDPMGNLAARMDVLDGPPVLFLANNPAFLLIGTGPGLMSLPAAAYIPAAPFYDEIRNSGVNSPPTSGLLLEVSNAGLIGLLLFLWIVHSALTAFDEIAGREPAERKTWSFGRSSFLVMCASYLVQASISPVWPVFLGCGLGAALLSWSDGRLAASLTHTRRVPLSDLSDTIAHER